LSSAASALPLYVLRFSQMQNRRVGLGAECFFQFMLDG
jgi:hypothetical protein